MSVLIIAEHDNLKLKTFSLNAINAASKIDPDVHVLVAGNKCENVCKEVGAVPLVKKVLQSDDYEFLDYSNGKKHDLIFLHGKKLSIVRVLEYYNLKPNGLIDNQTSDKHIVANFMKDYCKKLIKNLNKWIG